MTDKSIHHIIYGRTLYVQVYILFIHLYIHAYINSCIHTLIHAYINTHVYIICSYHTLHKILLSGIIMQSKLHKSSTHNLIIFWVGWTTEAFKKQFGSNAFHQDMLIGQIQWLPGYCFMNPFANYLTNHLMIIALKRFCK